MNLVVIFIDIKVNILIVLMNRLYLMIKEGDSN